MGLTVWVDGWTWILETRPPVVECVLDASSSHPKGSVAIEIKRDRYVERHNVEKRQEKKF
jgi:hypothetical protein